MTEHYDRKAAIAGRVHRRRPERRAYPQRRPDGWSTAEYVREYFGLNTRPPRRYYDSDGVAVCAYGPNADHVGLYVPLSSRPQPYTDDEVVVEAVEEAA
ncbi:MAG: hypothetical protein N2688_09095 [Burkholderiaceae bacterium]|nr:hypothetical protein [Burkholderiaceae bacterium]